MHYGDWGNGNGCLRKRGTFFGCKIRKLSLMMFFGLIVVKINISHTCDIKYWFCNTKFKKKEKYFCVEEKNLKYFLGIGYFKATVCCQNVARILEEELIKSKVVCSTIGSFWHHHCQIRGAHFSKNFVRLSWQYKFDSSSQENIMNCKFYLAWLLIFPKHNI